MDKKVGDIELFDREVEVINRVNILNQQGYKEEDMYIITNDENEISVLRGLTDIVIKEEDASIWDRFKSFLRGEDTITDAFNRLGLNEEDGEFYKKKITEEGKYLLFVDKDYGSYYNLKENGEYQRISENKKEKDHVEKTTKEEIPEAIRKDIGLGEEKYAERGELPHDVAIDYDVRNKM